MSRPDQQQAPGAAPAETSDAPDAGADRADTGTLDERTLDQMTTDARQLHELARSGDFAVDPESASAIADAYDEMVDEIHWIKVGMLTAGQHPKLGSSPYSEQVSSYQKEAAEHFLDAVTELETACRTCARAYREAAKNYAAADEDVADEFRRTEGHL